jgi:hypothetical protein
MPFQNWAVFVQGFPKIPLAVLWYFKGLQGQKTNKIPFQIFPSRLLHSGRIVGADTPRMAAERADLRVECVGVEGQGRVHGETVIRKE